MTVLVVGARGRIAAGVIGELVAAGVPVRAVTSDPSDSKVVRLPSSVQVWRGSAGSIRSASSVGSASSVRSAQESDGLVDALRDGAVRKVFLYADGGGVDGFLGVARDSGVEHVVLLSSLTARQADDDQLADADSITMRHVMVERAIAGSGIPWTFVRPGMFATNSLRWVPGIRANGEVRMARPGAEATPIHERDIVAVATKALVESDHEGARYALTGPESLSQRRQVELIGAAVGRDIRVVEISDDEARQDLGRWAPPEVAERLVSRLVAMDGVTAPVEDTVARVLGRPALTYAQWAVDHKADFS